MSQENVIKMVLPCECPNCGSPIIINMTTPYPDVELMSPEDAPEEIKTLIQNQNDNFEEPEAA